MPLRSKSEFRVFTLIVELGVCVRARERYPDLSGRRASKTVVYMAERQGCCGPKPRLKTETETETETEIVRPSELKPVESISKSFATRRPKQADTRASWL